MLITKWITVAACIFTIALGCLTLDQPSGNRGLNSDEIHFSGVAVSLATSGSYKATTMPDHLMKTDYVCASNPTFYPYCAAMAVKLFGIARWSIRLPSLLFFIGGFLCLVATCEFLQLNQLKKFGILSCYLGSPWLLQPAIVGRPEMLSVFLCYLATALIVCRKRMLGSLRTGLIVASWATVLAVWNSPLFMGLAALPFIIGVHFGSIDVKSPKIWAALLGGVCIALFTLFVAIIYPHWGAWLEQFPRNALTYSKRSPHLHGSYLKFAEERVFELKARASVLGLPFSIWYIACLGWLSFSRLSRAAFIASIALATFLVVIDLKTPTHFYTLAQFGAAVPLIFCLVEFRQSGPLFQARSKLLCALLIAGCFLHPTLLFLPGSESRAFSDKEALYARLIQTNRPAARSVTGPLEAAFPAWKAGLRYIAPTPGFFEEDPQLLSLYSHALQSQATPLSLDEAKPTKKQTVIDR